MSTPAGTSLRTGFVTLSGDRTMLTRFQPSDITSGYVGWLNDPMVVRFSNQRFLSAYAGELCRLPGRIRR